MYAITQNNIDKFITPFQLDYALKKGLINFTPDNINMVKKRINNNFDFKEYFRILQKIISDGLKDHEKIYKLLHNSKFKKYLKDCTTGGSCFMELAKVAVNKMSFTQLNRFLTIMNDALPYVYPLFNSKKTRFSEIRGFIEVKFGSESEARLRSLKNMRVTDEEEKTNKKIAETKRLNNNRKKVVFDIQKDVLDIIQKYYNSSDWVEQAIALLLACGSRMYGLLVINEFDFIKGKPSWLRASDLAKKRGKTDDFADRPILVLDPATFIKKLDECRERLYKNIEDVTVKNRANKIILNNTIGKRINRKLAKIYGKRDINITSKVMRKLYGEASYQLVGYKYNDSYNLWVKETLGHSDIDTSFNYTTITFKNNNLNESNIDQKIHYQQQEFNTKLNILEQKIKECCSEKTENKLPTVENVEKHIIKETPKKKETPEDRKKRAFEAFDDLQKYGYQLTIRNLQPVMKKYNLSQKDARLVTEYKKINKL